MKKFFTFVFLLLSLTACSSLSYQEKMTLRSLKANGITVDKPRGAWEKPASPLFAGLLNILPGIGNFYLGSGDGAADGHILYGLLNFFTWPVSPIWSVPEAAIDAFNINEKELVYFYVFNPEGQQALRDINLRMEPSGRLVPLQE